MKVKALTSFSLGGGRDVYVGDVFEMPNDQAEQKIKRGWVKAVAEGEKLSSAGRDAAIAEARNRKQTAARGTQVTARDPAPTHRDPAQAG